MRYLLSILIVLQVYASSCQKALMGSTTPNTPVNNFDELWKGFDRWYGGFASRNINWDSLYREHRPKVHNNMTNAELYQSLCDLLRPINDIHVFLQPTSDALPRFESDHFLRENRKQEDFSIELIKKQYLPRLVTLDNKLHYGITADNIGYLHFGEFGFPLDYYQKKIGPVMKELTNTRALVVDIRDHAGGDDRVSRYIAGWFAKERKLFMTTRKRNGPNRNDFNQPMEWYTDPSTNAPYTKPVILLTTRWTASAGETFAWAMNTQEHVLQMGDRTAGGFTDIIARELPNGWLYFLGVGDYRNARGESEEGKGITPGIYITNTIDDIRNGKDHVLEAAIKKASAW